MAIDSVGGDHVCRATSGNYRFDTGTARGFLRNYITLPLPHRAHLPTGLAAIVHALNLCAFAVARPCTK